MARDDDPPPAKRPRADCTGTSSADGEPPPAKRPCTDCAGTSSTSIHNLPRDLLLDIFLRLDSLSDLVRAACACRGWRDEVASSPVFRSQFIRRHPAPLLGFFFDPPSRHVPGIPSFAPYRGEDPMLVAALASGEFLLTNLQRRGRVVEEPSWFVLDARGGYLLLMNWDQGILALLNPLASPHERIFDLNDARIFDDNHAGRRTIFHAGVILRDDNPVRFDIFCLALQGESRLRAAIFSSEPGIGGGWFLSAWLEVPPHPIPGFEVEDAFGLWLESGMRVGNLIYWPYRNREHVVVLDPTDRSTPRLFLEVIHFPAGMNPGLFGRYIIGETRGGIMSIAYTNGFVIVLMVRGEDGMDAGAWAPVSQFDLTQEVQDLLGRLPEDHDRLEIALAGSCPCAWKQGKG
jgi:hypothetical protein